MNDQTFTQSEGNSFLLCRTTKNIHISKYKLKFLEKFHVLKFLLYVDGLLTGVNEEYQGLKAYREVKTNLKYDNFNMRKSIVKFESKEGIIHQKSA